MKKIALLLLAAAMILTLALSASAYFEQEEAFCEVKFEIGKQTTAWAADGKISDGEYYEVKLDPSWISYSINDNNTDADLAYAKSINPELYMSWDEKYVYMATRYTETQGHDNAWDDDPASMWYSGACQFNYANFDEVASEYRLEYGVGLTNSGNTIYTVWADGVGSGYEPTEEDVKIFKDGDTLLYESRVPWEAFADEDNTGYKEGNGFNFCFIWSVGKGQDYTHIQLAQGCSGNGKHAEYFAQVTLAGAPAGGEPAAASKGEAPTLLWDFNEDEVMSEDMGANSNNAVSFWGEKDDAGNDYYVFVAGGNDPYVSVDLDAEDVSDIVWCKARVKNPGPATAIELFGHTNNRGLNGSECTHINVASDNEWHTYIIYIPDENVKTVNAYKDPQYAISEPYWEGTVEWIRLDPMWQEGNDGSDSGGSMTSGDEIYIDYIAFFPTEEAAKAFRADQDAAAEVADTPTVANGTPTFSTNYQIPKAAAAPTIDGVKDAGEWDNALIMRINRNSMYPGGMPEAETPPDATFYYMWSEDGLYFFANVLDSTEPFTIHDPGAGSYNSGDGVQLNVYPDTEITGGTAGLIYFWSLVVNSEGTASVGEHFIFSDGASGADVPDVQAACTKDGTNYTIEAFFPASVWTESDPPIEFKEGTTFGMTNVVMEEDEGVQTLMCDSAWFNENNEINTYTFVSAAGGAAAEEPAAPTYTYPASGAGDNVINGTVIGNETGWGDNAAAGAAAAFDGDPATFFDPLGVGDGFCGIDAGESYILDKVAILSRDGWADRFAGAMIQGSNDGENWTTLWTSPAAAASTTEYTIVTEFENNTGYSQYRYFNETNHGDVAEVEFYGAPGKVEPEPALPDVENYALGAKVSVTSTETDDFPGELAVDGDLATRWASAYTDDEAITIDLGKAKAVNYVALYWETAMASDYEIYGSLDENDLQAKTLAMVTGNAENNNVVEFDTEAVRYITIHSSKRATEWGNSLYEIVVSGEGDAAVDEKLDAKAEAPNTFDFGVIAAVAAVISLGGFAVSKKRH